MQFSNNSKTWHAIASRRSGLLGGAPAWLLAFIALSPAMSQAQVVEPASQLSSARVVVYERDAATGVVTAETLEPDSPQHCLRREFTRDLLGNITETRESNCSTGGGAVGTAVLATRVHKNSYAAAGGNAAGVYPTTSTNAAGHVEQAEFNNAWGSVTLDRDANGLATTHEQDSLGRRIRSVLPDGRVVNWRYDYCSGQGTNSGSVAVPAGLSTCAPGAVLRILEVPTRGSGEVNGPVRATYLDVQGREVQQQTLSFATGDGASSVIRKWSIVRTEYDVAGRVLRKSEPFFEGDTPVYTSYVYDALGRETQLSKPSPFAPGSLYKVTHSYSPRKVESVNARGHQRTQEFDEHGRILRVTDAKGNRQGYHFTAWGAVHLIRDPLGNTTQVYYDQSGNKSRMVDPGMGTWTYRHDPLGQLRSQTSPKGQTAILSYDTLGRMIARTEPDLVSNWYFDVTASGGACASGITSKGELCEATADNQYRRLRHFDSVGRLTQESTTLDSGSAYVSKLAYDADSRVSRQTWPTGLAVDHLYDANTGALAEMRLAPSGQALWKRQANNARGQFAQVWYGNGVQTVNVYEPNTGLLQTSQAGPSGAPTAIIDQAYDYNPLGHLSKRTDNKHATEEIFTYDELNRLTRSLLNNTASAQLLRNLAYQYDALGNITSNSEVGTYTYATGAGARPHALVSIAGQAGKIVNPAYSYDANGNILGVAGSNGVQRTHTWTSFDNPLSFSLSQDNVEVGFLYGPEHQRIREVKSKTDGGVTSRKTLYVLHPDNEGGLFFEREVTDAGPGAGQAENRHYISAEKGAFLLVTNASALQSNPTATSLTGAEQRYWHKDHLGSIVASTNASLGVIERMAYDPFGKRRNIDGSFDQTGAIDATSTNRGFTGHEHLDELDFIHMNARVYDPDVGRFLSPDPTVPEFINPQAYNRYAYTINNPLNLVDRDGFAHTSPGSDSSEGQSSQGASPNNDGPPGNDGGAEGKTGGLGPKSDKTNKDKSTAGVLGGVLADSAAQQESVQIAQRNPVAIGIGIAIGAGLKAFNKSKKDKANDRDASNSPAADSTTTNPAKVTKPDRESQVQSLGEVVVREKRDAPSEPHGNKVDDRPATLYKKFDRDGNFLKHGITKHEDPKKRYTEKQLDGGTVVSQERGPRKAMIAKERDLVERDPGPQNRERWAGKRRGK